MHAQPAILIVDDEPIVIRMCEKILIGASVFAVLTAADGCSGFDLYHLNRDQIVLIVADVSMPVMGGEELARRVLKVNGAAKFIIMTGYGADYLLPDDLRTSCTLLAKPFTSIEFRKAVNTGVESNGNSPRRADL